MTVSARIGLMLVLLPGAWLQPQTQGARTRPAQKHTSPLGFTYSLPADWQVLDPRVDTPPAAANAQVQPGTGSPGAGENKGLACAQAAFTARHGAPASVIVVEALPYDCFGAAMAEKDLPGFASGASEGLKQTFDLANPRFGTYAIGRHHLWVERAQGKPKANPALDYTVEMVCGVLKKGAVCFLAMAADTTSLETFEHSTVALENEPPTALVPVNVFEKKP